MHVFIAGCGYTGRRVAERFLARGAHVIATTTGSELRLPGATILRYRAGDAVSIPVPEGALVLHSLPVGTPELLKALGSAPARVVYLSTTGVYGGAKQVDETTAVDPGADRVAAERAVQAGPWSSLVLRPAAIYGPGRGVHVAMQQGQFYLVDDGSNYVSRIHVDDLATHVVAALLSDVTGAWPVADDEPCTSREIAEFCAELLGLPMPPSIPREQAHRTRQADRRVDGSAIRRKLGIKLAYPSFREGIRASL